MVPDKFNMVDMEGIDILFSYGDIIPGLYQKLVESIAQCRYQCLYNWYFDGVLIPPTYVEMTVNQDTDDIWINDGVFVTSYDCMSFYIPSLETASGAIAYITDALSRKVKELICYINLVQSGSGDPSPDNIRPIIGVSEVNIFDEIEYEPSAEPKANVNWQNEAGDVYGASLTVNDDGSGTLVVNRTTIIYDGVTNKCNTGYLYDNWIRAGHVYVPNASRDYNLSHYYCDKFKVSSPYATFTPYMITIPQAGNIYFVFTLTNNASEEGVTTNQEAISYVNNWLSQNPTEVSFPIDPPITVQLTNLQVLTLLQGESVVWHDGNGDISVTYWKE